MHAESVESPSKVRSVERELPAIACLDKAGAIHWLRVFETSIVRRSLCGQLVYSTGRRFETPDGRLAHHVEGSLFLAQAADGEDWIELEAVTAFKRI